MGFLHYGGEMYPLEDRALLHVQIAIHEARARGKSFFVTWRVPRDLGGGRMSAWVDVGVPILFHYEGSRTPSVNRAWVDELIRAAMSGSGLIIGQEPVVGLPARPVP